MMFYIFNAENKCIGYCSAEPNLEDLATRGEYVVESEASYSIGATFENETIVEPITIVDYESLARTLRNSIRNKIDKYLLPASTINDTLVTEEQKQTLIQDSLLLAAWPATESWPYVEFPVLSELCQSLITTPSWTYPEQQ
jgi:hypothetical protein